MDELGRAHDFAVDFDWPIFYFLLFNLYTADILITTHYNNLHKLFIRFFL